jgi:hypothetical protein
MSYAEGVQQSLGTSTPVYFPETHSGEACTPASTALPLSFDRLYNSARNTEQKHHFTAIAEVVEQKKKAHALSSLTQDTKRITTETIECEKPNRLYHLICRLGALDPKFPQEDLFPQALKASKSHRSIEQICATLGIALLPESHNLIDTFRCHEKRFSLLANPSRLASEQAFLTSALSSLDSFVSASPHDTKEFEEANKHILLTLRSIYSSLLYEALCMSGHPLIDILHAIAIGQYTNTTLAPAFEQIGSALQETKPPLPKRIDDVWKRLQAVGIDDGIFTTLLHYTFRLLIKIGLPLLALKIAQLFSLNCLIPYIGDERSILGNTPGSLVDEIQCIPKQGEESALSKSRFFTLFGYNPSGTQRKIRTVVLCAPTLGYEVAPEFKAALQALENNQLSGSDNPFLIWAYTNLQNISFTPEHPSTIALMTLPTQYPLSFQAITLPQNLPELSCSTFSLDDVNHHLSLLFERHTSSLENRGIQEDSGYYFPNRFLVQFQNKIKEIAQDAYQTIEQNRAHHTTSELKISWTLLFHLGLTRLHETESFTRAALRTHRKALSTIRSTICASCVDRGGAMNASYLKALDPQEELKILSTGTYFGRAILSHRRSPTKVSVDKLSSLFSVLGTSEVTKFLSRITPDITSSLLRSEIA